MDQRLLSKEWRLSNLYSVSTKQGGKIQKFVPNRAQKTLYDVLLTHPRVILLKSRQLGITTFVTTYFLDDVLFNENINALSIMDKQENAIAAFDGKVRFSWDRFNPQLKKLLGWTVDTERANQLTFGFGEGKGTSSYMVKNSGRSGTFHRVHISEFGKISAERPLDAREIITGTFPAVPTDGKIIIESTAEGEIGDFADTWNNAVAGKNGFYPLFINWRYDDLEIALANEIPVTDLPTEFQDMAEEHQLSLKEVNYIWSKFLLLNRNWTLLRQEYPLTAEEAFQGSGDKLFDMEAITEMEKHVKEGKRSGNTVIYSLPKDGRTYVIGSDVAEGVFKDSSTAVVWEIDGAKTQVVATYASNEIGTTDFAYILRELSKLYNDAILAVERNNLGHAVIAILRRIMDESLLYRESNFTNVIVRENTRFGFQTSAVSKPEILQKIADSVRDFNVYIPSRDLLWEMRLCPKQEMSRTRTDEGVTRHFDLLMGAAIGYHAIPFAIEHAGHQRTELTHQVTQKEDFDPFAGV